MILYHGSTVVVKEPKILKSEVGRDFGYAFYATAIEEQAIRMAKRKQKQEQLKGNNCKAIMNVYEWDEDKTDLICKKFEEANEEWVDLVICCRKKPSYKHGFDIVEGKIADDRVGASINIYMDGLMSKEALIEQLQYQKINSQIAFCSDKSLLGLKFSKSFEVK